MGPAPTPGAVSSLTAGLSRRCRRCGQRKLYGGFLTVAEICARCGLALHRHDSGDGPAVFIIVILGFVVVGAALWVEVKFAPSYWIHALLWPPLILGGSLALLRPLKAYMIALQHRHRAEDYDRAGHD
ncbi:MAG: DUF983 domain-containing protein [Alphaproteobacteria bacterium]|nr:DUF983 domain-containing protein [Alphaproteobacteria bacterium]